jgi:hypothetical protein
MTKTLWAAALITTACVNCAQAAETIHYRDIPSLSPFGAVLEYQGFQVTTVDRKKHSGRRLGVEFDHVRVFHGNKSWEDIPNERIARIKITQNGRNFHHIVESATIPVALGTIFCGGWDSNARVSRGCVAFVTTLMSPVWAYTAVTAPYYLAADARAFLIPPKVYTIVH